MWGFLMGYSFTMCISSLFLGVIWSKRTWPNVALKMFFFVMALVSLIALYKLDQVATITMN